LGAKPSPREVVALSRRNPRYKNAPRRGVCHTGHSLARSERCAADPGSGTDKPFGNLTETPARLPPTVNATGINPSFGRLAMLVLAPTGTLFRLLTAPSPVHWPPSELPAGTGPSSGSPRVSTPPVPLRFRNLGARKGCAGGLHQKSPGVRRRDRHLLVSTVRVRADTGASRHPLVWRGGTPI
jgi:hypothetical protein